MALALKAGDELRLRISAPKPVLAFRIIPSDSGYDLALSSKIPGAPSRALGHHATEAAVWSAVAKLAECWPMEAAPLPDATAYELSLVLVIAGDVAKTLESQRFDSALEVWKGLADYAGGRQADIALASAGREENASRSGWSGS